MPTYLESDAISILDRQSIIVGFPCFSTLQPEQAKELASLMREVHYVPGEVIVTQDDIVDSIYFITQGEAEVTYQTEYKKKITRVPIAMLGPGESIGLNDTGFFSSTGKRTASVTAATDTFLLYLDIKSLYTFLQRNKLESSMYAAAEQMLRMRLIKQSLPFGKLSHERLQWLSERVEDLEVTAGSILFHQGDIGDKCYLIRSGKIEIIANETEGISHQLAILKPPTLFGEATLITQEPRNATARALEDTQLLVLAYTHLSELLEKEANVADMFMTLMVDRSRPLRNPQVTEYIRSTPDGRTLVILKNPDAASYFKLSQEGWFIWQQMNGKQTLLEITMALVHQYQVFSPNMVVALISKLARSGFITNVNLGNIQAKKKSWWRKLGSQVIKILQFRIIFKKADYWLTLFYDYGVKFLFTRLGQLILATIAISGCIVFFLTEDHIVHSLQTLNVSWVLFVSMIPLLILTVGLHELGHAFATKYFGREIQYMGVGWDWTSPVAFTDTSDMWLDTRGHRIVVNAAGVYANVLVAGFCALLVLVVPSLYAQAFLWLFAMTTYIKGFRMLNPAQDVDGYYIMMDLFDQPHLRLHATEWLMKKFPATLKHPSLVAKHIPEVVYWISCFIFITAIALVTLYVQGFVLKLMGMQPPVLSALILPAFAVVLSSARLISDIRNQRD